MFIVCVGFSVCTYEWGCVSPAALVPPLRIVDSGDVETAVTRQGCVCLRVTLSGLGDRKCENVSAFIVSFPTAT